MDSLGGLLDFTSNVAQSSSAENVEETVKLMVESAGNCIDADLKARESELTGDNSGESSDDSLLKNVESMLDRSLDLVLKQMVGGQRDTKVKTSRATLVAGYTFIEEIDNKTYDGGDGVLVSLPSMRDFFGNDTKSDCFLEEKIQVTTRSTKIFTTGGSKVNSVTAKASFHNGTSGDKLIVQSSTAPIALTLTRNQDNKLENETELTSLYNETFPWGTKMTLHEVDIDHGYTLTVDVFGLGQEDMQCGYLYKYSIFVFFRINGNPSFLNHDNMCELQQEVMCYQGDALVELNRTLHGNNSDHRSQYNNDYIEEHLWGDGLVKVSGKFRCFLNKTQLSSLVSNETENVAYFGMRHTLDDVIDSSGQSVNNQPQPTDSSPELKGLHYAASAFSLTCLAIGDDEGEWKTDGCDVAEESEPDKTICRCNHLTTFGAGLKIPINKINLKESAFTKLDENPVAFTFMLCCLCLYLIIIIWARKADQRDIVKAGVTPLPDNNPTDPYQYEITVFTGLKSRSGTTAKVSIILSGDANDTKVRKLRDTKREVFQRGGVDSFLMTTAEPLGSLMHLRIWHDNSGKDPSWFMSRVIIRDLGQGRTYYFMLDRWLAVEEDDGNIERVIPVAGKSELTAFGHLFYSKTRRNLSDSHLWFSVFARPAKSRFTRVQRATCCLSLLFSTMMANIFFYNVDFGDASANQVFFSVGPMQITMAEVVIGVISSLMVFPINLLLVQLFRLSRPVPKNPCQCCKSKKNEIGTEDQDFRGFKIRSPLPPVDIDGTQVLQDQLHILEKYEIDSASQFSYNFDETTSPTPRPQSQFDITNNMMPVCGYKKTKKKKTTFELPWGFVIIGWILALMSVGVSCFLVIEVAGTFGKLKATEWLMSMLISLVQDIFLTQPVKVFIIAAFFSLIIKDPEKEDSDEPSSLHLQKNEEWLHRRLTEDELSDPKKMAELENEIGEEENEEEVERPEDDMVNEARAIRFKEIQMMKIIKEIIFYIVFLNITMLIAFGERDGAAYDINKSLENMFITSSYHGKIRFNQILTKEQFWNYTINVFVPTMYDRTWYNGEADRMSEEQNLIADQDTILLGPARLRQVRIEPESCDIHRDMVTIVHECRSSFNMFDVQENDFDEFWMPVNTTVPPDYRQPYKRVWQFRDSTELNSSPIWGYHALYPGGGYAIELGNSLSEGAGMASYLRDSMWIDRYTRAVLLEFVMYNANINMHSASSLIVEMMPSGGIHPFMFFWTTRIDRYTGSFAYFIIAGQIVFCLFILYFFQHEVRKLIKEKREYFKDPWNYAEMATIFLSITAMVFYGYRYISGRSMMAEYAENRDMFMDFHFFANFDQIYGYMIAFVVFIANIKFLRILRFNRRMLILSITLRYCSKDIGYYCIVFGIVFSAFVCSAYGIFNLHMADFSTLLRTTATLFSTVLGKFNFYEMLEANRVLGPIFFFGYVLVVVFVLLNMFLSIINTAFSTVRNQTEAIDGEMEIVDFMIERFKRWSGFSEPRIKADTDKFDYVEGVDPMDKECTDLQHKLTGMVDELNAMIRRKRQEDKDYMYEGDVSDTKKIFLS